MQLKDLPDFIQKRLLAMPENVREAMLETIDQSWVDTQVAAFEIMKGLEDGRWTIEDIRNEIRKP